jgi:hypothetical protein
MSAPDSTAEEVRSSVLKYLRMYEEGTLTLNDLAAELGAMAPAYEHVMGGITDNFGPLLAVAHDYFAKADAKSPASYEALERALTNFRRREAAWK